MAIWAPLRIGSYILDNPFILAPMAGVTDRPFRQLCKRLGAGMVVSEMVSANPALRQSQKTRLRLDHEGEVEPRVVQIAGGCPDMLADAARYNVDNGAQIIDINMGCPAKKVCQKAAGSALLKDEKLVEAILMAVVKAVSVPVTLKIRTGWDRDNRNGVTIAKMAEYAGICALAVHGRTRACGFKGGVEYETMAAIKASVRIPVIANGDISSPEQAKEILAYTGADGVMLGRAAQGKPWIFEQFLHYFSTGEYLAEPTPARVYSLLSQHLEALYAFYGEFMGVQIARKHVAWYCKTHSDKASKRYQFNQLHTAREQLSCLRDWLVGFAG